MTTGLNHLTLAVRDVARSVAFYCDVVGCTRAAVWDGGAYLRAGELWLCLSLDPDVQPGRGYTHVAFSFDVPGLAALRARVAAAGAVEWKQNRSEGASVYFLDPDGHRLEGHVGDLESRLAAMRAAPYPGLVVHEA